MIGTSATAFSRRAVFSGASTAIELVEDITHLSAPFPVCCDLFDRLRSFRYEPDPINGKVLLLSTTSPQRLTTQWINR